ncbi:ATP-binding protein [Rathayibacter rathayi]|uniref:ATP-binding protein n=1 Tax=Rathayibacter rathayi TaxID=33887 RepID=A0ABD6WAX9_RATRA|nr:ATP-binding protein [Rathayibacter rathayi]AZZ49363.1 ATP-binding protein [Rathayibacter rathayi]MWV73460.1 ATP-binding protein [Rathayibacter rathayi NCPPB 2980 = VKM Ac-1601]PPF14988.1 ATP-binding protein [Rathayibacter rathayi]PPF24609.1 ATP-binding protein [Rathayibacter rathayi]PPF50281.1 ATP-binding protein [Rathayibacter rathayi]
MAGAEASTARRNAGRERIDTIISTVVSFFGFGFGVQTVPPILAQLPLLRPEVAWPVLVLVFGSLSGAVVTAVLRRGSRVTAVLVAVGVFVAVVTWPAAVAPGVASRETPWVWYLLTIGTAFCTIAAPLRVAIAYAGVTTVLFGVLRVLPSGGGADPTRAILDAAYVGIVGFVMLVLITVLRQSADQVDRAQTTATQQYEAAMRQHAGEVERVEVDALVHDNVLATLLSAASAESPAERALVSSMAQRTLAVLLPDHDPETPEGLVPLERLHRRLALAASTFGTEMAVKTAEGVDPRRTTLPRSVAEALLGAVNQALANSVQHAGPSGSVLRVVHGLLGDGVLEIVVEDNGRGFRLADVPRERLGIRLSILERVHNARGIARIDSAPGEGTRVVLSWHATAGSAR